MVKKCQTFEQAAVSIRKQTQLFLSKIRVFPSSNIHANSDFFAALCHPWEKNEEKSMNAPQLFTGSSKFPYGFLDMKESSQSKGRRERGMTWLYHEFSQIQSMVILLYWQAMLIDLHMAKLLLNLLRYLLDLYVWE